MKVFWCTIFRMDAAAPCKGTRRNGTRIRPRPDVHAIPGVELLARR
jgi:hypothetical protein